MRAIRAVGNLKKKRDNEQGILDAMTKEFSSKMEPLSPGLPNAIRSSDQGRLESSQSIGGPKRRLTNKELVRLSKLKAGLSMDVDEVIDIKNLDVSEESEGELERTLRPGDRLFKVHSKCRVYDDHALYCLKGKYKVRKALVWLVEWPYFENFILFCIFLNSISLAIFDYNDRKGLTTWNQILEEAGLVFNAIFTFECVAKITATGFLLHRKAYLRDAFNVIDFVVVISG